ncbi:MAG: pyruvate kinase [Peptostreptococcaceae bacterium]|nr:pyruvate kinase [Peptostreptococcaceae bacterium]
MRKTKIVCTIGPASSDLKTIESMMNAGMNVGRINLSHGNREEHKTTIDILKEARKNLDMPLAILYDTRGPEIRLKNFVNGFAELKEGQSFTLTTEEVEGDQNIATITYRELPKEIKINDQILIDDGKITLKVINTNRTEIQCEVLNDGRVSDHKGLNVPHVKLNMEYLNKNDSEDIIFGIKHDINYVAASFARRRDDVIVLRNLLDANGGESVKIIAKIENNEGLENFEEIMNLADGIMVARGDMGVEVAYELLPGIQKKVIRRCREEGKIVITATQMLESMISSKLPTRAEITDVANAVFDGTSAIMLSGETAMGKYPIEVVNVMSKIALRAESDIPDLQLVKFESGTKTPGDTTNAVSHGACTLAEDIDAKALLAITKSGDTANKMAKFRSIIPILASTPNESVYNSLALVWGVKPMMVEDIQGEEILLDKSIDAAKETGYLSIGDKVVVSLGVPLDVTGNTNTIRVIIVK